MLRTWTETQSSHVVDPYAGNLHGVSVHGVKQQTAIIALLEVIWVFFCKGALSRDWGFWSSGAGPPCTGIFVPIAGCRALVGAFSDHGFLGYRVLSVDMLRSTLSWS